MAQIDTARLAALTSSITGYFSQRLRAGDAPKYGYPGNHSSKSKPDFKMPVVIGFMAAQRAAKTSG